MKFTLRPYQTHTTQLLRESLTNAPQGKPIMCLPTGAGKTVTFSYLIEQAQRKHKRVAVVCHRTELIEQARSTVEAYGLNPLLITFGMVQTYVRSPHKIPEVDLVIIDECHIGNFRTFINLLPETVTVIGATATPISSSNKNPLRTVFTDVVSPVQIRELIDAGYLARPVYHIYECDSTALRKVGGEFTPESQAKVFDISNLIEAVQKRVGKTIIFCASIDAVLNAVGHIKNELGIDAYYVHSKMKQAERAERIEAFKSSSDGIIINCGILTAGFDDPQIQTVIVYRATTSVALWLQMCGRGSRPAFPKFYIFDLGGNTERLLAWEANRNWKEIFKLQGRKLKDKEAPMKKCVSCQAVIFASARKCSYCGTEQPTNTAPPPKADRVRIISDYGELPSHLNRPYSDMSVAELVERASYGSPNTGRPFKIGWIVGQLRGRATFCADMKELARIKGYSDGWIWQQMKLLKIDKL